MFSTLTNMYVLSRRRVGLSFDAIAGCSATEPFEAYTYALTTCDTGDNAYYGDCPALTNKSDRWCDVCGEPTCYASDDTLCCDTDGDAVAGLIIGLIVFSATSITTCAYCCKCCCFRPKPQTVTVATMQLPTIVQQPVVPVQQIVAAGVPVQPAATGKICAKCGNGLDAQAGFCAGCGAKQ